MKHNCSVQPPMGKHKYKKGIRAIFNKTATQLNRHLKDQLSPSIPVGRGGRAAQAPNRPFRNLENGTGESAARSDSLLKTNVPQGVLPNFQYVGGPCHYFFAGTQILSLIFWSTCAEQQRSL